MVVLAPMKFLRGVRIYSLSVFFTTLSGCDRAPSATVSVAINDNLAPAFRGLTDSIAHTESLAVTYNTDTADMQFARMIASPTGPDVFISSNASLIARLTGTNRCVDSSRSFLGFGALVLVTSDGVRRAETVQDLSDLLYARVAVANPEQDPFGRAAMQVLNSLAIMQTVGPRIVRTSSSVEALAMVRARSVQAAIVPRMIVGDGDSLAISSDLHQPIEHLGVVCAKDPAQRNAAIRFLHYVREGAGKSALEAYGLVFP
jgi:molybdenum ABC transporter molybdate-binding protein